MIGDNNRQILIKYRLEQAESSVSEAELLIDHNKYRGAVNRIYYGMFYCLLALGNKFRFETSKHSQLIGWFNKNFIKEKKIDQKYGKILREAFKARRQGDYDAFIDFSSDDVLKRFEDMKDFIYTIKKYIDEYDKGIHQL